MSLVWEGPDARPNSDVVRNTGETGREGRMGTKGGMGRHTEKNDSKEERDVMRERMQEKRFQSVRGEAGAWRLCWRQRGDEEVRQEDG